MKESGLNTRMAPLGIGAFAAALAVASTLAFGAPGRAATIVVNSLDDPGAPGICALRDAITAANSLKQTNGCRAGSGQDAITFAVTGTIGLTSTLPVIQHNLTIDGPPSPGITIDGGNAAQAMQVSANGALTIDSLTIAYANTGNFPLGDGGGIYNYGSLTVVNSLFSDNFAAIAGGAIGNEGTATIANSRFNGNLGGMGGGGIENSGTMSITNTTFAGNGTPGGGGGIVNGRGNVPGGSMSIVGCTFSGNTATDGGAIENNGGTLSVTNSTFFQNAAAGAGGIDNTGTLTVASSTFAQNQTISGGAAISSVPSAVVKNSILAASSFTFGGAAGNCAGTISDGDYNLSDDNSCALSAANSRNNTDPVLDPAGLESNGGPTATIALVSGSPAIDVIPQQRCTDNSSNPLNTDQRGALRPDAGEAVCDIGAYEYQVMAGRPGCLNKTTLILVKKFGGFKSAIKASGFSDKKALMKAIEISCGA